MPGIHDTIGAAALLQADIIPTGTRVDVFQSIYGIFLVLGTIVGIVVVSYMLYNAYKYRAGADKGDDDARPELGELPRGSGGGRKLFMSFGLSAVIVISLIAWTYGTLLYVEQGATSAAENAEGNAMDPVEVRVVGYQFGWEFHYESVPGHEDGLMTRNELIVPEDRMIRLNVTARDVWHNFGIPELRVKSDAIPGQYTQSWFEASETGEYTARCYELCGTGHSQMQADVNVTTQEEFEGWYAGQMAEETEDAGGNESNTTEASG